MSPGVTQGVRWQSPPAGTFPGGILAEPISWGQLLHPGGAEPQPGQWAPRMGPGPGSEAARGSQVAPLPGGAEGALGDRQESVCRIGVILCKSLYVGWE